MGVSRPTVHSVGSVHVYIRVYDPRPQISNNVVCGWEKIKTHIYLQDGFFQYNKPIVLHKQEKKSFVLNALEGSFRC